MFIVRIRRNTAVISLILAVWLTMDLLGGKHGPLPSSPVLNFLANTFLIYPLTFLLSYATTYLLVMPFVDSIAKIGIVKGFVSGIICDVILVGIYIYASDKSDKAFFIIVAFVFVFAFYCTAYVVVHYIRQYRAYKRNKEYEERTAEFEEVV